MKKFTITMVMVISVLIGVIKIGDVTFAASNNDKEYFKYYTNIEIKRGDTLSDIAYDLYNNPDYDNDLCWDSYKDLMNEIIQMNDLPSKNVIHSGNYIVIPYAIEK